MNNRERFHAIMNYQPVDRSPAHLVGAWTDTLARWHNEGLPQDVTDYDAYLGLSQMKLRVINVAGLIDPVPGYEIKVLEENAEEVISTDSYGRKVKNFKHSTSMPEWIDFAVKDEDDLKRFLDEHFTLDNLADRFPAQYDKTLARIEASPEAVIMMNGGGFYWTLRSIAGVENASYLLYDAPELVEELFARLSTINLENLRRVRERGLRIDVIGYGEDLAYKTGTLLSRDMFRSMILPLYQKFLDEARKIGATLTWYDSDGDLRPFMEDYFEIGIEGFAPCEVAANMEPVALRKQYGKRIKMLGGFDKRIVATGKAAILAEFDRLRPVIQEGGYFPAIDHSVSADISWDNYRHFTDALKKELGWA